MFDRKETAVRQKKVNQTGRSQRARYPDSPQRVDTENFHKLIWIRRSQHVRADNPSVRKEGVEMTFLLDRAFADS
jgi:hypothetical protein